MPPQQQAPYQQMPQQQAPYQQMPQQQQAPYQQSPQQVGGQWIPQSNPYQDGRYQGSVGRFSGVPKEAVMKQADSSFVPYTEVENRIQGNMQQESPEQVDTVSEEQQETGQEDAQEKGQETPSESEEEEKDSRAEE